MASKRIIFLLSILLSMFASRSLAYDIAVENADGATLYYNYINDGKELEVTFTTTISPCYRGVVDIPEEVTYMNRTRKVTSIGDDAFGNCINLTSITIPNSVTSIGNSAFGACINLTSITIPNSVTAIGEEAFVFCSALTSLFVDEANTTYKSVDGMLMSKDGTILMVYPAGKTETAFNIPNSVTTIGKFAFKGCSGLTSITIPNSVTSIGDFAFEYCTSLTSVTIPNSVTNIGFYSFESCRGLTSVTIGNNVTSIGRSAFQNCGHLSSVHISDLESWCKIDFGDVYSNALYYGGHLFINGEEIKDLIIPNSVTSIGGYAFYGCISLTSVTIPNSVTSIGGAAFAYCNGLNSITIPNSVTSIGDAAFSGCTGLTSITIGNNVTSIGRSVFSGCSGLISIVIPNSVTSIGDKAFLDCSGLTSVTIANSVTSIGGYAFRNCFNLTSITIPNSVTSIGGYAFCGCISLTSVTIPNSVTSIGNNAFSGCDIPEVISKIENPFNIRTDTFSDNTFYNATLYVPSGTIDKYKTTNGWKKFVFIEEGEPSSIEQVLSKSKLIQGESGMLIVRNIENGTLVNVYNTNGTQVGSAISQSGQATIDTNLQPGSVAIVKIGEESIKVMVK